MRAAPLLGGEAFRAGSGHVYAGKSRTGILRGYGNAICAPLAAAFVECVIEWLVEDLETSDEERGDR